MDPIEYIVADVATISDTYEVWVSEEDSNSLYDDGLTKTGTVECYVYSPAASDRIVIEGSDQETSLTGLVVPEYDSNGTLVHHVEVGNQLRLKSNTARRYNVKTKQGISTDIDPNLWQLGLEKATSSE